MNEKRPFKFYLTDDKIETNTNTDYLSNLGMTQDFIKKRQQQQEAHYVSEMYYERQWRNRQLQNTLYVKQLQVIDEKTLDQYISALKEYDLKYQPRPTLEPTIQQTAFDEWLP